jgi:peroxiredoxin family protein
MAMKALDELERKIKHCNNILEKMKAIKFSDNSNKKIVKKKKKDKLSLLNNLCYKVID